MHRTLTKKVVVLTGFNGKLAQHFAKNFAADYDLVGISRKSSANNSCWVINGDINENADSIIEEILQNRKQIDVLINNAVFSVWKPIDQTSSAEILRQFSTNVVIPMELSQLLLEKCWKKEGLDENIRINRSIVHISSISGINAYFGYGQGVYAATKSALNTLAVHQASELGPYGIRVNSLAPNTFPAFVSLDEVCQSIRSFIEGNMTGEVKILDKKKP